MLIYKISDLIVFNALKNIILNSDQIDKKKSIAYFCGDNISSNLDIELKREGLQIDKIINCTSEKITDLNEENSKIIKNHPPDIIFIYSTRSAESFVEIVKKYALNGLMTESRVLCISEKVLRVLKDAGWKKLENFEPGEEIIRRSRSPLGGNVGYVGDFAKVRVGRRGHPRHQHRRTAGKKGNGQKLRSPRKDDQRQRKRLKRGQPRAGGGHTKGKGLNRGL